MSQSLTPDARIVPAMDGHLETKTSLSQLVRALSSGYRLPGLSPKHASRVTTPGHRSRGTADIVGEWVSSETDRAAQDAASESRSD